MGRLEEGVDEGNGSHHSLGLVGLYEPLSSGFVFGRGGYSIELGRFDRWK